MSTSTKATKATKATAAAAAAVPATTVPATTQTPQQQAAAAALYTLNAKAAALAAANTQAGLTLQAPGKGLGMAWRTPGHKAPNTRAIALATVLATCGNQFTAAQAQAALATIKPVLGSGTPNSYVKAFLANGYFAQVVA